MLDVIAHVTIICMKMVVKVFMKHTQYYGKLKLPVLLCSGVPSALSTCCKITQSNSLKSLQMHFLMRILCVPQACKQHICTI